MKKIENKTWKVRITVNKDGKLAEEERTESLLVALTTLMNIADKDDIPKGFDQFRTFGRLAKAFDKAEKSGFLEIEDADYVVLKEIVKKKVPAQWAMNKNINDAITIFMDAGEKNEN